MFGFLRGGGTTSGPAILVDVLQPPLSCVIDSKDEYIIIHLTQHRSWDRSECFLQRCARVVQEVSGGAFWLERKDQNPGDCFCGSYGLQYLKVRLIWTDRQLMQGKG